MEKLERVLLDFDRRLGEIEKKLQITPAAPTTAAAAPRSAPASPAPVPSGGGSLFGLIGIGFVLLAAVFFLKLTIESGWLTPYRQVSLAALFGLACLLAPHVIARLADDYGALLSGAGAAILHVTWFGAFQLHHLISAHEALVAATAVGTLSILLNARLGNAVFVVVAVAGTYLSAALIGYNDIAINDLSSFLLVWNICFSTLAFLIRRRDVMMVAAFFAVLTLGVVSLGRGGDLEVARALLLIEGIQFAIFAGAMTLFSLVLEIPLTEEESGASCLLLLLFYAHVYFLLEQLYPFFAPYFGIALSAVVLALYAVAERAMRVRLESTSAILTFAALALVHSAYLRLTPEPAKPGVSLALAILLATATRRGLPAAWRVPVLILWLAVLYGVVTNFSPAVPASLALFYHFAYGVAALAMVGAAIQARPAGREVSTGAVLLGFAHVQMLYALYQLSERVSDFGGSLFVSLTWGAYALAVLAWGFARHERVVGQSAVLILVAVALKGAFYDVLQTGSTTRVLSLLAAGLLLYACGWFFRQMQGWRA